MTTIRRDNQSWISNTRMIKYQCKLENCVSGPHFEIPVHQWLPSTFAIYLDQQKFSFNLECESIHEWMLGKLITNPTFFRVMITWCPTHLWHFYVFSDFMSPQKKNNYQLDNTSRLRDYMWVNGSRISCPWGTSDNWLYSIIIGKIVLSKAMVWITRINVQKGNSRQYCQW